MPKEDIVQADQPVQKKKKKRNKKKSKDKKLVTRLTDPCVPITKPQTTIVPQESEYCYSNSLIAIESISHYVYDEQVEMNFRFKDGQGTQKYFDYDGMHRDWYEFNPEKAVDLIEIFYDCWDESYERTWGKCCGLRLFDTKSASEVFKTSLARIGESGHRVKKIWLEEGEKILGIKCRRDNEDGAAVFDLQFVLGKMV